MESWLQDLAESGGKDLKSGHACESPSWYKSANQDQQVPDLMESWLQDLAESGGKGLKSGHACESPSRYQPANQDQQGPDLMESCLQDFAEEQNLPHGLNQQSSTSLQA